MFLKTFFYMICFIIFMNSLSHLIEQKNLIFYKADYRELEECHLSICLKIKSANFNCSDLVDPQYEICSKLKGYFEYIENQNESSPNRLLAKYEELNLPTLFTFQPESNETFRYLYFKHLCFAFKLRLNKKPKQEFKRSKFTNKFNVSLKLFLHTRSQIIPGNVVKLNCFNFKSCNYFQFKTTQFLKNKIKLDCSNYTNEKFDFKNFEIIDSKIACVMECIKKKHRLAYFFYSKDDTQILKFNDSNEDLAAEKTIEQCELQCILNDCSTYFYHFSSINYFQKKHVEIKVFDKKYQITATFHMESANFWRNLIGLVSLFLKFSCLSFVLKSHLYVPIYMKRKIEQSIVSIILWACLCYCLLYGYYQAESIYRLFFNQNTLSYFYVQNLFEPANFSLALCKTLKIDQNKSLFSYKEDNQFLIFDQNQIFKTKFDEIEKNIIFSPNRTFLKSSYEGLQICFSFDIKIEEARYRSVLSLTSLFVNLTNFDFFLIEQFNKSVTTKSLKMEQEAPVLFWEYRELICEEYGLNIENCSSRQNCIDKCHYQEFLKINRKLPLNCLVYLDDFQVHDLRLLYFDANTTENQTILDYCENKFIKNDCYISNFTLNRENRDDKVSKNLTIDLFFTNEKKGKILSFNLFQTFCSFITLYTIILGISWVKITNFFVNSINLFNSAEEKFNFQNLIFFLSIFGFTMHSFYLYQNIFWHGLSTLVELKFEPKHYNEQIPSIVFCLKHNFTLKTNSIITGNILNEKTSDLNETYLFEKITYYDLKLNKIIWYAKDKKYSNNFRLELFFFLQYRCYEIVYKMNTRHFKNSLISTILKIRFNSQIKHSNYLFISKLQNSDDFSKSLSFNFNERVTVQYSVYNVDYTDQYQILANPKLWFKRELYKKLDVNLYMNQLRNEFKIDSNCSTKLIPLTKRFFDLEINDDLFEQYNLQFVADKEKSGLFDLNYNRTLFDLRTYSTTSNLSGSIEINNIQYSIKTEISNNEGILLNFLNAIFLWFNFYLVELLDLIYKLAAFLLIFRPKNIQKQFLKLKRKFESFFIENSKRVSPISNLNNRNL